MNNSNQPPMSDSAPKILFIIEHGGVPVYPRELIELGYRVITANTMRKALTILNREVPDVVIAEFNYVSTFRDRVSNLESLLARLQTGAPHIKLIVVYDKEHQEHLDSVKRRYDIFASLLCPVTREQLLHSLQAAEASLKARRMPES